MPRDGSGVFSVPPGTSASPNTTILSAPYNAFLADLEADLNAARPVTAGGTGLTTLGSKEQILRVNAAGNALEYSSYAPYPTGHLWGLTLSNNGSDATNDIDIAVGSARSSDDSANIDLTSALTKQLDAAWAVGTNQGMLATGAAVTNTTYYLFLIKRPDTGVVDVAADTSSTGANIAANTNAAYTLKTLLGTVTRSGGVNGTPYLRYGQHWAAQWAAEGQLKFPATQNPSSDANTLDDYEEGTWTPTIEFGGGSTGITYSAQGGYYTKVGNLVNVIGNTTLSAKGSSTGNVTVAGIPFSPSTTQTPATIGLALNFASLTSTVSGQLAPNIMGLYNTGATGISSLNHNNFTNTSRLHFSATYIP